jgi:hypothetical protein
MTQSTILERVSLDKAYRYQEDIYSSGDEEFGYSSSVRLNLLEYEIIKRTAKGIWIIDNYRFVFMPTYVGKKFVNLSARKKFACLTKEEAVKSFIARKERQIKILNNKLKDVELALRYGYSELNYLLPNKKIT